MIPIEFYVDKHISIDEHTSHAKSMNWFAYLVDNSVAVDIYRTQDSASDLDLVIYSFYLKNGHETIYRIKYPNY